MVPGPRRNISRAMHNTSLLPFPLPFSPISFTWRTVHQSGIVSTIKFNFRYRFTFPLFFFFFFLFYLFFYDVNNSIMKIGGGKLTRRTWYNYHCNQRYARLCNFVVLTNDYTGCFVRNINIGTGNMKKINASLS